MENNILLQYMESRIKSPESDFRPGPFVTISRDYGCPAKEIAALLSQELNKKHAPSANERKWQWIGKEILQEAAKELNLQPEKLNYIFDAGKRSAIDEVLQSLSAKYYQSDAKIRKTISAVVKTIAEKGNIVIVGRGGVALTQDIPRGIHIKLNAPFSWRLENVMLRQNLAHMEAVEKIASIDEKREALIASFSKTRHRSVSFDLTFNCETFNSEQIVNLIIQAMLYHKQIV